MLRAIIAAVAAVAAAVCTPARALDTLSPGALRVCLFPDFPPVVEMTADGVWRGEDVAFLRRFAESQGLAFVPVLIESFSGIWRRPGAGECDLAASGITRTEARMAETPDAVWSTPYRATARSLLVRVEDAPVDGVEALAGRRILTVLDSTAHGDLTRRAAAAGVTVEIVGSEGEQASARAVAAGEAFGFALGEVSALPLAAADPSLTVTWLHPFLAEDGSEGVDEFSFISRKASTGLPEAVDAWIAAEKDAYGR
ncbi:MAG: transporter substrate-binding domain-containing protein [Pseudomonadota bacterium]